jgi:hypothetical protein
VHLQRVTHFGRPKVVTSVHLRRPRPALLMLAPVEAERQRRYGGGCAAARVFWEEMRCPRPIYIDRRQCDDRGTRDIAITSCAELGDARAPREASPLMRPQTVEATPRRQYWLRRRIDADARSLPCGPDETFDRRERTLCASAQRPQRRIQDAYLGQVCVAAGDPITLRRPTEDGTRCIFGLADENDRSSSVSEDAPITHGCHLFSRRMIAKYLGGLEF